MIKSKNMVLAAGRTTALDNCNVLTEMPRKINDAAEYDEFLTQRKRVTFPTGNDGTETRVRNCQTEERS